MERVVKFELEKGILYDLPLEMRAFWPYLYSVDLSEDDIKEIEEAAKKLTSFWQFIGFKYVGVISDIKQTNFKAKYFLDELIKLIADIEKEDAFFSNQQNIIRRKVREEIEKGLQAFEKCSVNKSEYSIAVIRYLNDGISQKEKIEIQELPVVRMIGDRSIVYPLTVDGEYNIGIVNPWPGDKSAEAEVLSRFMVGAKDAGLGYIMLDNFGHILENDTQKATQEYVNPADLEYVITTHYDTEKTVDAFYYHTLWNPPEIPLNLPDYDTRVSNNYIMNDDYLIYDFGGMSNHLKTILNNKPRTIEGASSLTASFPKSRMLEPKLDNPKLFYCGMNWEKVVSNSNRHEGLFKLLDETGKVKFFGPDKVEAWGGLRPWEGYKCYQYSIPFDGFSILDEINDCGICLVLSSDIHRRAGAATNRTYEACAAGAVIISDDNEFMLHYFKDAALFIEYNKEKPQDTFEQIMEKYEWIVSHKDEALQLAKNAQAVFRKMFSVDNQLLAITNNHLNRFKTIENDLFAKDESGNVLVTYVVNTLDLDEACVSLDRVVSNVRNQYYANISLGVACDSTISERINAYLKKKITNAYVLSMELYDHKGSKKYTDGQAICLLQNSIKHDYWMNIYSHEVWFYDHVTTLIRTIIDADAVAAYAGRVCEDEKGYRRKDFFNKMHISTVFGMNWPDWLPVPGQVMIKSTFEEYVQDYVMECLDGYEHYAYLGILWIKNKKNIVFTQRMTSCWRTTDMDQRNKVLKAENQIVMIRDQLKYYIPDGGLENSAAIRQTMKDYLLEMPIRKWIPTKWWYVMRNTPKKQEIRVKRDQKYWKWYGRY